MDTKPKTKGFAMNISENTTETYHDSLGGEQKNNNPILPTFNTASEGNRSTELYVLTDPLVGKSIATENPLLDNEVSNGKKHKLYPYRWLELGVFCLAEILNQLCWISMQPIAGAIENGYGVGSIVISSIGVTFMVVYILFNFPANLVLDKIGLRFGVILGTTLTAIGMWVKVLVNVNFNWVLVG